MRRMQNGMFFSLYFATSIVHFIITRHRKKKSRFNLDRQKRGSLHVLQYAKCFFFACEDNCSKGVRNKRFPNNRSFYAGRSARTVHLLLYNIPYVLWQEKPLNVLRPRQ